MEVISMAQSCIVYFFMRLMERMILLIFDHILEKTGK